MADTNLGFCADMLKGLLQLFMFFDNQLMDVTKVFYMYSTLLYSLIEYLDLESYKMTTIKIVSYLFMNYE